MGTEERDADLSAASAVVNGALRDAGEADGEIEGARTAGLPPVTVDEPPEPRRIRRQPDLMRLLFESAMIVVVLLLGRIGVQTTSGLESDIHNGVQLAPSFLLGGITVLTNITTAIIPVGLAVERLVRRDGKRVADAVIAAALAYGLTSLLNFWIESSFAPKWLLTELTRHVNSGTTSPLHIYISTLIAFLTVLGFNDRPTLRTFTWVSIGIYAVATLMSGDSALVGLIVTFLLGRLVAFGWRYACGVVNERPTGQMVVQMLSDVGFEPVACSWQGEHEDVRRYEVRCADGRTLDVTVLDRDRQAVGLIYRVYRRIRLRGPAQRRNLFSLRRTVDQEALISYALRDAGIRTPKLVAVRELNADAALLAYEGVHAVALADVPKEKFGDEMLARVWQTVKDLGRSQIAHRRLALDSILVDEHGEIWLTELRNGEVAAADLQQLLDIAETMTALALKAGPERTVRIGAEVLGEERIGAALPMLQPVVLTRTTRSAVRKSKHLLQRLREQILELRPHALTDAEPVKLERLSPKTLLTVAAACFAVYVLLFQLSTASKNGLNFDYVLHHTSLPWLIVAIAASALTYLSAAMVLTGFIPEKLPLVHNLLVQIAAGFVSLVAPAAVGGVALNTRYMQKRGIATGPAVSAVGASQAVAFVIHIALLAAFSFIAGQNMGKSDSSTLVIAILLAIALLVMITMSVPPLRHFAKNRLAPFFADSLPRLLDVAQSPRKLSIALGGTISLSLFNALCLWASIHTVAPNNKISYATTTVVYLTAQTAGSFIPVPSGVGTVETAMAFTLKAFGVDYGTAVLAVLLFRLLRTYLPAIPGYITFSWLTRKGLL
ncbi:lysylphosphatidylglycerol synthase transmembrane domain-containing protein [Actinospica sp.]|uniref:lysylphosphatidylglycerol synthase transmembrane domain-containing protein n=1 Tax=Actinospica sp. TaxID=1872142 RepID=UPI002B84C550|nr:lysylphosphatidylglycerol synthase transmembrane domain-containing protein [Actinospica sp.]HWG24734.1 lysylphosphatidylglycerol synthase transmembrane domain-containing protein [Actinospica sp.]